ncbi:hypothetical protein [Microbacterium sp. H1-D42]|uniref:hypothetical protein n=1 Tax=Microbacterium sp. H1-D42 TaxID=2925844 RepID=UPI001F52D66A|nr:hypothetical protein [Microbacterium sp. H1-D42]UNK69825.1 hypothetical protein MNR00_11675 [Microbacterium sp. H1-D42]
MTDAQKAPGGEALAVLPGLQLLGDDTAMGVCVDGVCVIPGSTVTAAGAEKRD